MENNQNLVVVGYDIINMFKMLLWKMLEIFEIGFLYFFIS